MSGISEQIAMEDARGRRMLWTAAAALASLLVLQIITGAPPIGGSGGSAHAGMVGQAGQHTILSADASNEDVLLVLDGRNEELMVYRTDATKGIQIYQRLSLPQVFTDARARGSGR
jgi:hypothetical protein